MVASKKDINIESEHILWMLYFFHSLNEKAIEELLPNFEKTIRIKPPAPINFVSGPPVQIPNTKIFVKVFPLVSAIKHESFKL